MLTPTTAQRLEYPQPHLRTSSKVLRTLYDCSSMLRVTSRACPLPICARVRRAASDCHKMYVIVELHVAVQIASQYDAARDPAEHMLLQGQQKLDPKNVNVLLPASSRRQTESICSLRNAPSVFCRVDRPNGRAVWLRQSRISATPSEKVRW
jgi:sulfite reductase alpha subunit-like flavoprotein